MDSESVTETVKLDSPAFVGVPEITPVLPFRDRPTGNAPAEILHEYGIAPPFAGTVAAYASLTVPPGTCTFVIESGAAESGSDFVEATAVQPTTVASATRIAPRMMTLTRCVLFPVFDMLPT